MSEQFTLRICTPKGIFLEEAVQEVTLPSSQGEMGILPGHADYTGLVGTGVMEFVAAPSNTPRRVVISGGFISYQGDTLTILSDVADSSESIEKENYAAERATLQEQVESEMMDSPEWTRARTALDRIEAIDELISH
ncbi:ATP synthase F1 subunit epsilon [bacterium]|nr:ATP synthase F1 subunit epsilon [bacterium]